VDDIQFTYGFETSFFLLHALIVVGNLDIPYPMAIAALVISVSIACDSLERISWPAIERPALITLIAAVAAVNNTTVTAHTVVPAVTGGAAYRCRHVLAFPS